MAFEYTMVGIRSWKRHDGRPLLADRTADRADGLRLDTVPRDTALDGS